VPFLLRSQIGACLRNAKEIHLGIVSRVHFKQDEYGSALAFVIADKSASRGGPLIDQHSGDEYNYSVEQITKDFHDTVAIMESMSMNCMPVYSELKQITSDLDLYRVIRHSPGASAYAVALLDRVICIARYVERTGEHAPGIDVIITALQEQIVVITERAGTQTRKPSFSHLSN
jgi:hypothetical protein